VTLGQELYEARNLRPASASLGMANAALEAFVLKVRAPWTLRHSTPDHAATEAALGPLPMRSRTDELFLGQALKNIACHKHFPI